MKPKPTSTDSNLEDEIRKILAFTVASYSNEDPAGNLDAINSATQSVKNLLSAKLSELLEKLPEKNNRPHKMFDGGYTAEVTAYADGFDLAIDQVRAAITTAIQELEGKK